MNLDYAIGYFFLGAMFLASIFGIFISIFMPGIDKLNRKFFALMFGNLTLFIIAYTVDVITWRTPAMLTEERIAIFFEYFCYALTMPIFTIFLLRFCGESLRNKLFYSVAFLFVIYLILLGVAQFTEIFYYVTAEDFYYGEWNFLLALPVNLMSFLNIFEYFWSNSQKKIFIKKIFLYIFILFIDNHACDDDLCNKLF